MSPVSRRRKKRRPSSRPTSSAHSSSSLVAAGFDGLAAEMLRAFRPLAREPDPLDVEVFTSGLLGALWNRLPPGEDPDMVLGLDVVDRAERAGGRVALALLRALAVVGVAQELRDAASAAAATLAASGVGEPPWAGRLGRVEVGDCWRLGDLYGDQASLLVVFGYGRRRHGLVALVDFNHLGGWVPLIPWQVAVYASAGFARHSTSATQINPAATSTPCAIRTAGGV